MSLKEIGTLPVGVEVDGQVHRDFVLRPRLVRDSVEVMEDPKAQENDAYRGVALMAAQLEKLGELPREKITTDLLLSMFDMDMATIMEAASRLDGRLLTFRSEGENGSKGPSGAA